MFRDAAVMVTYKKGTSYCVEPLPGRCFGIKKLKNRGGQQICEVGVVDDVVGLWGRRVLKVVDKFTNQLEMATIMVIVFLSPPRVMGEYGAVLAYYEISVGSEKSLRQVG